MGANLVGFLMLGPVNLSMSTKTVSELIGEARKRIEQCKKFEESGNPKDMPDFLLYEEDAADLVGLNPEKVVRDFIKLWNDEEARDWISRRVTIDGKEYGAVFAGDMSWGDDPSGAAYQTIKPVSDLGMLSMFGIL